MNPSQPLSANPVLPDAADATMTPLQPADVANWYHDGYPSDQIYQMAQRTDPAFQKASGLLETEIQKAGGPLNYFGDPATAEHWREKALNYHYWNDTDANFGLGALPPDDLHAALVNQALQTKQTADHSLLQKVAHVAGQALPLATGIVGGVAGSLGGPLGAVAGAGAGYAGGAGAARALDTMTGYSQPQPPGQELGQMGKDAAVGAASEMGGQVLGKVGGTLLSPFLSRYEPEIAQIAAKRGVQMPASALSSSNVVKQGEALASKGLFGSPVQKMVDTAGQQITRQAGEIISKLGGSEDLTVAGKSITEGADKFRSIWQATKNQLYSAAEKEMTSAASKTPINFDATKTALDDILSGKSGAQEILGDSVESGRLRAIRANLDKPVTSVKSVVKALDELGQMSKFGGLVQTGDEGALKKVAATMSNDLEEHIRQFAPEVGKALDRADTYYAKGIKLLDSGVGDQIAKLTDSPEKIVQAIVKPNSASDTSRLLELVGQGEGGAQRIQNVRTAFANKLVQDSSQNGVLSGPALSKTLTKYGGTVKALYDADTNQALQEVAKLASAFGKSQGVASGSQTAFLAKTSALLGALFSGHVEVAAGIAAGDVTLSKIFSTDVGRKWITEGLLQHVPQSIRTGGGMAARAGGMLIGGSAAGPSSGPQDAASAPLPQNPTSGGGQ